MILRVLLHFLFHCCRFLTGAWGLKKRSKQYYLYGMDFVYGEYYHDLLREANHCQIVLTSLLGDFQLGSLHRHESPRPTICGINLWYSGLGRLNVRLLVYSLRFSAAARELRNICLVPLSEVNHSLESAFPDNQEITVYSDYFYEIFGQMSL